MAEGFWCGVPIINYDYSILGSISGSPYSGKLLHVKCKGPVRVKIHDAIALGVLLRHAHLRFRHPAIRLQDFRGFSYQACAVTSWLPQRFMLQDIGNGAAGFHMDFRAGSIGTLNAHLHWSTSHGIETEPSVNHAALCPWLI